MVTDLAVPRAPRIGSFPPPPSPTPTPLFLPSTALRLPPNSDEYFLGYGHNYLKALRDYTAIGGSVPVPPRHVFGVWFSRYWAFSGRSPFTCPLPGAEGGKQTK